MLRNVCNLPYCKERLARWSFEAIFVKRLNKKLNNKNQNIGQIPYDQFTQGDKINKYTLWWSNWSIGKPYMLENNDFAKLWNGW